MITNFIIYHALLIATPKHYDALFHLCLLKEKMGDRVTFEILRLRLQHID
jgi:chemotaxis protein methyltransferase WspC